MRQNRNNLKFAAETINKRNFTFPSCLLSQVQNNMSHQFQLRHENYTYFYVENIANVKHQNNIQRGKEEKNIEIRFYFIYENIIFT